MKIILTLTDRSGRCIGADIEEDDDITLDRDRFMQRCIEPMVAMLLAEVAPPE